MTAFRSLRDVDALRHFVSSLREGIYVTNARGDILDANPACLDIVGVTTLDELTRFRAADLYVDPGRRVLELELLARDGAVREFEFQIRRPDGQVRTVLDTCTVAQDPGTTEALYFGILVDITDRKRAEDALQRSLDEQRRSYSMLSSVIEGTADIVFVKDDAGRYLMGNEAFAHFVGKPLEEIIGAHDGDLFKPEDTEHFRETDRWVLAHREPLVFESTVVLDGVPRTHLVTKSMYQDREGRVLGIVGIARDITARKQAEQALRESEERYALAASGANDGLWDWDLRADRLYFSPRWKAMLGHQEKEIGTTPDEWFTRVHADDLSELRAVLEAHLAGTTAQFESSHRVRHRDGTYRWMLTRGVAVRDPGGRAYRMAGSQTDVTERKLAEEQLLHDAFHDALTGLPNRALFMEELQLAVDRAKRRRDYSFSVLFLDFDQFKVVNDSLGHLAGDQLLMAIARRIQQLLRPADRVARLGGDEFTILLEDIGEADDATRIAERMQSELEAPFNVGGHEVFTTVSVGIALSQTGYERAEHVLRDADLAMYRAKALGRGHYEVFDLEMHARAVARLQLETDLRRAIERQEFRVHYQAIVSQVDSRVVGLEALMRWQHPRRGLLLPAEFLALAEETNLIIPMGRWLLREACGQLTQWTQSGVAGPHLRVSVNLSGKQLLNPRLAEEITGILEESGVAPGRLTLEVTENVIMENAETSASVLKELKARGVRIDMDDFGTGYSSLSYLRRFPLDALKIDRSFVNRMEDAENLEIVRTIITLARNLGLSVVAEGVETSTQWVQLRALGCEYLQGYFFSPPVDAEGVAALLAKESTVR